MAAPLYIPSSSTTGSSVGSPISTTVITSSYTVPVGRFAKLVANLEGSATLTINGVTALRGTQNSVLGSSPLNHRVWFNAGASRNENVLQTLGADNVSFTLGSSFASATDQKTVTADLSLPAGTVIAGTGTWRATVMLF